MGRFRSFRKELFRRKVIRLVVAYLAVFWAIVAGLSQFQEVFGIPNGVLIALIVAGIAATPLVALLAWKFDIVPPHVVRDVNDIQTENPGLSWARVRHDSKDAGFILLSWTDTGGGKAERRYFQPVAIGRDPSNEIELSDDRVSRHHAVIWAEDCAWHIRDLDSANGIFIGHSRVEGRATLPPTCDLRFHVNGPVIAVRVARSAETRVG